MGELETRVCRTDETILQNMLWWSAKQKRAFKHISVEFANSQFVKGKHRLLNKNLINL